MKHRLSESSGQRKIDYDIGPFTKLPDLVLCNFWLLPQLMITLKSHRFTGTVNTQGHATTIINSELIDVFRLTQLITLDNDWHKAQFFLIHLLRSPTCTCFKQYLAHPQEVKLY
jgi:hypothetical protein